MKYLVGLCFFLISFSAAARGQNGTSLLIGLGVSKTASTVENDSHKSQFDGWIPQLELGLDVPFGEKLGMNVGVLVGQYDLTNVTDSQNFIEKMSGLSTMAKLGFFYGRFGFGAGFGNENLKIKQVSSTNGTSETEIKGATSAVYLNYSFDIQPAYRLTFELQRRTGTLDDYKYTDISGGMKFFVLF